MGMHKNSFKKIIDLLSEVKEEYPDLSNMKIIEIIKLKTLLEIKKKI